MNDQLKAISAELRKSYADHDAIIRADSQNLPNKRRILQVLERLRDLLFPHYFGKTKNCQISVEYSLEWLECMLTKEIKKALGDHLPARAEVLALKVLAALGKVRETLATDISAAFDGDPAATSTDEIISSYPGLYATMVYRLAHIFYTLEIPLIGRIMSEHAHSRTGIDIHPGATIGHHFFIDHGTGIVIGETTVIGNFVKIYQGVTLGGISTRGGQALRGVKRHPTVEDCVTIYSGASIFGGDTVIGFGAVIGSNAFVARSIPARTKVSVKNPELQYKDGGSTLKHAELMQDEFWSWVI